MQGTSQAELRLAARCRYLRTTLSNDRSGHLANFCRHLARDGSPCVGPFLDDFETGCGLWEHAEPLPGRAATEARR
jgi:hypothetical protein